MLNVVLNEFCENKIHLEQYFPVLLIQKIFNLAIIP